MMDFSVNTNTGYTQPYCASSPAETETDTDNQATSKYDELLLWQACIQSSIDECTLIDMEAYSDLEDADEWNAKFEEVIQKYTEVADGTPYSFTEEGKSYGEALDELAQSHINAYDIIDSDGKITFEEYKQSEILEYNHFLPEGETPLTEDDEVAAEMFKSSFNFMDFNDDNVIDKDEVKTYYVMADMFDSIENPPENPEDAMDGNIKFSSVSTMSDIMACEALEGSEEAENKEILRSAMTEIYETNKTPQEPENKTELPKANEPTAKGKMALNIEKNLLKDNPFKKQDE